VGGVVRVDVEVVGDDIGVGVGFGGGLLRVC